MTVRLDRNERGSLYNPAHWENMGLLLVVFLAAAVSWLLWEGGRSLWQFHARSSAYDAIIAETARRHGVDPCLVKAVIWRETRFSPLSVGAAGEIGLMQIMPGHSAADWSKRFRRNIPSRAVLFSPELNIEIGTWYLAGAVRRWKNYREGERLALCEYNAGLKRAMAWKPDKPDGDVRSRITIASTKAYADDVLKQCEKYRRNGKLTNRKPVR